MINPKDDERLYNNVTISYIRRGTRQIAFALLTGRLHLFTIASSTHLSTPQRSAFTFVSYKS